MVELVDNAPQKTKIQDSQTGVIYEVEVVNGQPKAVAVPPPPPFRLVMNVDVLLAQTSKDPKDIGLVWSNHSPETTPMIMPPQDITHLEQVVEILNRGYGLVELGSLGVGAKFTLLGDPSVREIKAKDVFLVAATGDMCLRANTLVKPVGNQNAKKEFKR